MPPKRRPGGPGGAGGPGGFQPPPEVVKKYDKDGDGKLKDAERQAMMAGFQAQRGGPGGPGESPGAGGPPQGGPNGP